MIFSFKEKCELCRIPIDKDKVIRAKVKLPEFLEEKTRSFCSQEHVQDYKTYVKGTPCKSCSMR